MAIVHTSTLTAGQRQDKVGAMRRTPKHPAPEGFINLLQEGMKTRKISLNQLAERAGFSPAFLSRILNKQRGLPSDKTILRLAQELDLEPRERLLIEAGRIPEELKRPLNRPEIPALLRATGKLSETDLQEVIKAVEALVLKRQRGRKRT
jgi:transcriptional regulator with XRE-family HTH domain